MTGSFLNQAGKYAPPVREFILKRRCLTRWLVDFEQAVKSLQVGPGMSPVAQINPLASRAHCDKVCSFLDDAQAQQAELIRGSNGTSRRGGIMLRQRWW